MQVYHLKFSYHTCTIHLRKCRFSENKTAKSCWWSYVNMIFVGSYSFTFSVIFVFAPMFILEVWGEGSTICGKRVLRASFQEKVGDLYEIYTKENGWCWWNIQQKFDNFSSCPTINTSLSRSTLSSLGEKIPSMINSRSNQRCADIFIRSPPPSTIVLEMILSRAGPDHIWKDNRKTQKWGFGRWSLSVSVLSSKHYKSSIFRLRSLSNF